MFEVWVRSAKSAKRYVGRRKLSSIPDRQAFESACRSLLLCNFDAPIPAEEWNLESVSAPNIMIQNIRALQYLGRKDLDMAEASLEQCIEALRGPMMGTTSDSYVDMGGILVDLAMSKSDEKEKENTLKRAFMMVSKAYKVNTHLNAGVQANLCEFYRKNSNIDQACTLADQLLLSLNSSHGGHEMSTKSRWGGDGMHGHNYDFLWSDLCFSDLRSAQYYYTVGRTCGNFRSASEACIHFNRGFQALSVHIEAFLTTRINGVPEMAEIGGSLAHMIPTFVEGCIDLATVKATSAERKIVIVDKVDYLRKVCTHLLREYYPDTADVGIGSSSEELLALVRAIMDGERGDVTTEAITFLKPSLEAAEKCIAAHKQRQEGASAPIDVGDRSMTGLALMDARFHLS